MLIESELDLDVLLRSIVSASCELVGARYGALGVLSADGTELTNFITHGLTPEEGRRIGDMPKGHGLLGQVIIDAKTRRSDNLTHDPAAHGFPPNHPVMTTFLGVPVTHGNGRVFGNLYLTDKTGGSPFDDDDVAVVESFGRAAGLIVDEARLRQQMRQLTLTEERERLARDLHDTVIQRLFAVGLSLNGLLNTTLDHVAKQKVSTAIDDLDATIREIRTTIFEISRDRVATGSGFRARASAIVDEVATRLGLAASIAFDGAIDTLVGPDCADQASRALRELLTNVVRHAQASRVRVEVRAKVGRLELVVADDGQGFESSDGAGKGLDNVEARARDLGGEFSVVSSLGNGTIATWTARHLD